MSESIFLHVIVLSHINDFFPAFSFQMSNAELGVKYSCYGEYKCYRCNKTWASLKSWRNFGQKCKSCNDSVKPDEESLLQLYYYVCKTCEKVWKNKHIDVGQSCKNCSNLVKPIAYNVYVRSRIGQPSLFKNSESYDLKGGHREDLCEKCQKYGPPCSVTSASATNRSSRFAPSSVSSSVSTSESNPSRQVVKNNSSQSVLVARNYGSRPKANDGPATSITYASMTKRNSSHVASSLVSELASPRQVVQNNSSHSILVAPNYRSSAIKANDGSAASTNRALVSAFASTSKRHLPRQVTQNNSIQPIYESRPKANTSCIIL